MTDRRKKVPLTEEQKHGVWNTAMKLESYTTLATIADKNLATTRAPAITMEQREALLVRIIGGEFLGSACSAIGVNAANVRKMAFVDEEFNAKLTTAYAHGMYALAEELLDIPYDDTLSDASKKLKADNIKWLASRLNRTVFGDNVKHELTVRHEPVVLPIDAIAYDDEDGL